MVHHKGYHSGLFYLLIGERKRFLKFETSCQCYETLPAVDQNKLEYSVLRHVSTSRLLALHLKIVLPYKNWSGSSSPAFPVSPPLTKKKNVS
jgi:hypothetical protein